MMPVTSIAWPKSNPQPVAAHGEPMQLRRRRSEESKNNIPAHRLPSSWQPRGPGRFTRRANRRPDPLRQSQHVDRTQNAGLARLHRIELVVYR